MEPIHNKVEAIYKGESAIIAWMNYFPEDYFLQEPWNLDLPKVENRGGFPFEKIVAPIKPYGEIYTEVGSEFQEISQRELKEMEEKIKNHLNEEILNRKDLQTKSGNRRLGGKIQKISLLNNSGDLTLDFENPVALGNFKCHGSVKVKGNAVFDTLRIYANGDVSFSGSVTVHNLEVYSGGNLELGGTVVYSGIIFGKEKVLFINKARMNYPAVVASLGEGVVFTKNHEGVCKDSLNGKVRIASVASEENPCVLPAYLKGKMYSIGWGLKR